MNTNESAQAIRNMTPEVQQTINEMMGMIEYNPRRKAVDRLNYVKSVEALSANGDVDISMDPQFLDNGKTYINDMPFDQANAITKFVVDAFYINRDINQMKKVAGHILISAGLLYYFKTIIVVYKYGISQQTNGFGQSLLKIVMSLT